MTSNHLLTIFNMVIKALLRLMSSDKKLLLQSGDKHALLEGGRPDSPLSTGDNVMTSRSSQ